MAEIFERTATTLAGAFSADTATMSMSSGVSTALVQNMSATYMQNITRLFEIGNVSGRANVYYVGGRSQGQLSLGRVIGPAVTLGSYYRKFGNVCNARTNTLAFAVANQDCGFVGPTLDTPATYSCRFCVITQIGIAVAAQDMIINESSALMFSSMDYTGP